MPRFDPESSVFKVNVERSADRTVLAASGELDIVASADLTAVLREHLAAGPVLLDLRRLSFIDSSGVKTIDTVLREADREGWTLAVHPELQPPVRRALELTGMLELLPLDADGAPGEPGA